VKGTTVSAKRCRGDLVLLDGSSEGGWKVEKGGGAERRSLATVRSIIKADDDGNGRELGVFVETTGKPGCMAGHA
jgi:hypothetical protein